MDTLTYLACTAGVVLAVAAVLRAFTGRWLTEIKTPSSSNFWTGHNEQIFRNPTQSVGDVEKHWCEKYGTLFRIKGCLGMDELMVADPMAIRHITQKSGYRFRRTAVQRQMAREINGGGILFALGQDHARIRKIMGPGFSAGQLRSYLPAFQLCAQKLRRKWESLVPADSQRGKRMDVQQWLTRCTLDAIGKVGFDIDCGALDDSMSSVIHTYKNMFAESLPYPSRFTLIFRQFWPFVPMSLLWLVKYIPTKDHTHFRHSLATINDFAKSMIGQKTEKLMAGQADKQRDIMSILVRANHVEDPKHRLSDSEMISMMTTFLLAGHETTSSSLTWLLYELAKHPEYQAKMRREVIAFRARATARGDLYFAMSDFNEMEYTVAAVKELLRLHPIVYLLNREASEDDVLPLSYPITTSEGKVVQEVPIPRGTTVWISVWMYNRLPQVWGPDADEFNPFRFIEGEGEGEKMTNVQVGMTANVMTFSAGLQGCIGWKFAMIEMQTILVELIEHFEFSIPEDKPEMIRMPASGMMMPLVKGDEASGLQMPLHVSPVR